MLDVENLACDYRRVMAVSEASIRVRPGEIVVLIGANGAGKSTTVKAIAGAKTIKSGQITFEGSRIDGIPSHEVVERGLALVPEGRLVFQHLTVLENLLLAGHVRRARDDFQRNLDQVVDWFPRLKERFRQNAGSLSGGEQQMLAIARGLMTRPRLLILDEPSLGLSPLYVGEIFKMIRKLNETGMSILLVEQNVHLTLAMADFGYVIEKGRIIRSGEGKELLNDPMVKEAYLGVA